MSELAEVHGQPGPCAGGEKRRRKKKNARPDAWTEFRGVSRRQSGKFGAQIREPTGGAHSHRWLGTFDAAEDAARAYDAAAVEVRGESAITNFKQPAATDDGGVSPLLAEPSGQDARTELRGVRVHRHPSVAQTCGSKGKAGMSLGGFDLTPAEWQQADELLNDMDYSTADREALIEAAAVLRHIALSGHGDGWRS